MKKTNRIIISMVLILILIIFGINMYVKFSTKDQIISSSEAAKKQADCILILGAGVWGKNPSPMLEDRLLEGINLYNLGASKKILMSGDHTKADYDEVNVMKDFALEKGIDSNDIFMDHAGISTYDSIYRVKEIFDAKKVIIVTQKYHLYRALYIANKLGLEAYGVSSDPRVYSGQTFRNLREVLARDKDFISCIFKRKSKFLGDKISLTNSGDVTNDK